MGWNNKLRHTELLDIGTDSILGDGSNFGTGTVAARPSGASFTDGLQRLYYASDEDKLYMHVGGGGAWVEILARSTATAPTPIRKTAAQTKNASTTLSDVTDLTFPVAANEVWEWEAWLWCHGSATADIKFAFTVPAGFTRLKWAGSPAPDTGIGGTGVASVQYLITTASGTSKNYGLAGVGIATGVLIVLRGVLVNGATAGNVQLQFAQQVSDATDTVIEADSIIIPRKIA